MAQLKQRDRDKIEALKKAGQTQEKISDIIGCSQSTISRELDRNSTEIQKRYTASIAENQSKERRINALMRRDKWHQDRDLLSYVIEELRDGKSPEQISGRMNYEKKDTVSHQAIYNYIAQDKQRNGVLCKYLRYQGKKYKWRGFSKNKTKIPNRRDISERPQEVDDKSRYGDWETDLVVSSRKGSGAVATFAERRSMYFQAKVVESQSADEMLRASVEVFENIPEGLKYTMTHDNGKEICKHELITEQVKIDVYCARPYKSCDRGLNEWMNRELRRFFPKGTDFSKVTQKEIDFAVLWLNNCPRKSLYFRTPQEVFDEQSAIMRLSL